MNRMIRGFLGLLAVILITSMWSSPAHADDSTGPVVGEVDDIVVFAGSYDFIEEPLLAAVTHPDGKHVWVCGAKAVDPSAFTGFVNTNVFEQGGEYYGSVGLGIDPAGTAETVDLSFVVCDGTHSTEGFVTIDVRYPTAPLITNPRAGRLKFTNLNGDYLECGVGSFNKPEPDMWFTVEADSSKSIRLMRTYGRNSHVDWMCTMGPDYVYVGSGTVKGIIMPSTRSLRPTSSTAGNATLNKLWTSAGK